MSRLRSNKPYYRGTKMIVKGNALGMLVVTFAICLLMYGSFTALSQTFSAFANNANNMFWLCGVRFCRDGSDDSRREKGLSIRNRIKLGETSGAIFSQNPGFPLPTFFR